VADSPPLVSIPVREDLPEFDRPPVIEVALGIQFEPAPGLRGIDLGDLRSAWADEFPIVSEQPPLPPMLEDAVGGEPGVQVWVGAPPTSRVWFLSSDEHNLIQVQQDRLIVNWRAMSDGQPYPRYAHVRGMFVNAAREVAGFVERRELGQIVVRQVEVNYINAVLGDESPPPPGSFLDFWGPMGHHHLGEPSHANAQAVFDIRSAGTRPVRMYVTVNQGTDLAGHPASFLTLAVRGAPVTGTIDAALESMDAARGHIVKSFAEITSRERHEEWGLRRRLG
jgi:uncharacterized protein (TIGR04255 family)